MVINGGREKIIKISSDVQSVGGSQNPRLFKEVLGGGPSIQMIGLGGSYKFDKKNSVVVEANRRICNSISCGRLRKTIEAGASWYHGLSQINEKIVYSAPWVY